MGDNLFLYWIDFISYIITHRTGQNRPIWWVYLFKNRKTLLPLGDRACCRKTAANNTNKQIESHQNFSFYRLLDFAVN